MKKFVISSLIFILILLAAFAGIAWYFFASNGSSPALPGEVKQSEQIPTYEEMLKTKEESNKKDAATYNKAIIARNETMCDSISDANKKAECHDTIVAIQAEAS